MNETFSAKMDFSGRVALVTGGASGIGFAVASQLAELGAKIAIADINIEGANNAADKLSPISVFTTEVDVQEPASVKIMIDAVVEHYGKLDILIHSAGVGIDHESRQ